MKKTGKKGVSEKEELAKNRKKNAGKGQK